MSITGSTPEQCWKRFQDHLFGYWGRLQIACRSNQIHAPNPVFSVESHDPHRAKCVLGGDPAVLHVPMARGSEVADLLDACRQTALIVGSPAYIALLGIQRLRTDYNSSTKVWELKTESYKYSLLCRTDEIRAKDDLGSDWSDSFALRIESESEPGMNSWLLNHPVHHLQFGSAKHLRFESPVCRSLVSTVDWVLRSAHEEVWGDLYTNLYLELQPDPASAFSILNNSADPRCLKVSDKALDILTELLIEGRTEGYAWYTDLKQWHEDTSDWTSPLPELIHGFSRAELFI